MADQLDPACDVHGRKRMEMAMPLFYAAGLEDAFLPPLCHPGTFYGAAAQTPARNGVKSVR